MAEIPIEKKGGTPWWVWLLVAAAVVGLLVWLFAGNDRADDRPPPATRTVVETPAGQNGLASGVGATTTGAITDSDAIFTGGEAIIGREVRLTNVPAGSVPADAGFWITGDAGQREYVVLHEVRTPNTPIEGAVDVNNGDRLDIVGVVRSAADGAPQDAAIPGPTKPLPAGITHFIEARSVTQSL